MDLKVFGKKKEGKTDPVPEEPAEELSQEAGPKQQQKGKEYNIVFYFNDGTKYEISYDDDENRNNDFDAIVNQIKADEFSGLAMSSIVILKDNIKYIRKEDVEKKGK